MRKTVFIIVIILLFSCSQKSNLSIEIFPTINLRTGIEKNINITNFISGFTSVAICETEGINATYNTDGNILSLMADGTKELIVLPIIIDDNEINLLIQVSNMVPFIFKYKSKGNEGSIIVMGQFNDWSRTALPMSDEDGDGVYERMVYLKPQRHEYKFVVDGEELIDPSNPTFVSNNIGGWNSVLNLAEFKSEAGGKIIKKEWEKGLLTYQYYAKDNSPLKELVVLHNNDIVSKDHYEINNDKLISIDYLKLGNGTIRIAGIDEKDRIVFENITIIREGRVLNPIDHPDDWHFSVLYNVMTDRFLDGNKSNTVKIIDSDLHDLANWHGGDFAGIIQKLDDGYFTELGINSLWISPVNRQPDSAYVEWIEPHEKFSGYHGYWPIAAREIDPRYGTKDELHRIIELAHAQDIKVILDFVSNHVHEEHNYYKNHPEWFGAIQLPNGEMNIRNWSEETRLTTWFDEFIPSFDYPSAPEAINQVVDDAVWWMETFNLDGFRQDAVKHVPHKFWKELNLALRSKFPDKDFYQIGETFGSDDLILDYVNPNELDAQFNFDVHFNSRKQFASDNTDFAEIAKMIERNIVNYHPINLMGNITSSHDQFRFIGPADGQVDWGDDCYERSFFNPPGEVRKSSSYSKLANYHAFNISMPGIPVVYYGEEIGLMGSCDPGNRHPMRFGNDITEQENELLAEFGKLNDLRRNYPALSLGDLEIITAEGPLLIIEKSYLGEKIIVVINNGSKPLPITHKFPIGKMEDALTGKTILVDNTNLELIAEPYSNQFFEIL